MNRPLTIAISSGILHENAERDLFDGRELHYIEWSMADWIARSGALALALPYPPDVDQTYWEELVKRVDGVILLGGADVAPESYGDSPRRPEWAGDARRDAVEMALGEAAMKHNVPLLGICRGHQLINVMLGGTLHQDIEDEIPAALQHRNPELYDLNSHDIAINPGSRLAEICGGEHLVRVNSVHHQAIEKLADGLVVEARSVVDDVIEAIRLPADSDDDPWVAGVQWHPEFQRPDRDSELLDPMKLLEDFYAGIRRRRR